MPSKNTIKIYASNGYYHVYNRGVEKRTIFVDDQDYKVFLSFLKWYLTEHPKEAIIPGIPMRRRKITLFNQIELLAYCLMPNHFHFLVHQHTAGAMKEFMQSLSTGYALYFNKKYQRVGSLFQGPYKAAMVDQDSYLLHLSRYIHLNPMDIEGVKVHEWPYSSYGEYLGQRNTRWIHKDFILSLFGSALSRAPGDMLSYQSFVEDGMHKEGSARVLDSFKDVCLDLDAPSTRSHLVTR